MNMTFKIDIDRKKIEAIRCYLPDGNVEQLLHEEITKAANSAVDKLYNRNVPKKVQEFLRRLRSRRLSKKRKKICQMNNGV